MLRSDADLPLAVHEIYREWRAGRRVLAVVSALGCTADDLLKRAQQLGLPPQREGLAALLGTGETAAAALLTLALDRSGLPATLLDPIQMDWSLTATAGRRTRRRGHPLSHQELERAIVVVPGGAGRDPAGRVTRIGSISPPAFSPKLEPPVRTAGSRRGLPVRPCAWPCSAAAP